jgi:hypothetical protein
MLLDSNFQNIEKIYTLVRGAKWDTYDFVYKIDFCVDKSGFVQQKWFLIIIS